MSCAEVAIYASRSLDLLVIPSQTFFSLVKYYPKIETPLKKAFEFSRNYILPITMDVGDDESSGGTDDDILSEDSEFDSRSGSSRLYLPPSGHNSVRGSQSTGDVSQAKSGTSVGTYQSYMDVNNLLKPGSRLFQSFGYLTSIMATLSYILTLYEVITLNDCNIIVWLQSFFDIFFYIKIYLSMHQGFVSRNGELVMNAVRCRKRYYKHKLWVWTDLFANLPLELFGFCFTNPLVAMHYFRINKLLRLKYLIEFYRKTSAELTNNLTTLQAAMTVLVVALLTHTFTCVWLMSLMATSPISIIRTIKTHLLVEDSPQRLWDYTSSLYVIVSELTTTGGDEFVLDQTVSMTILSICLVCGKLLASTVVATSIQIAYSIKYTLNNYEKYTKELMDVLKNQGLSTYQMNKFSSYTRQLWVHERGRQLPELIKQSPYVLKCDLMSAMFGQHLRNCYIFADTGEPFLRQLTVRLDYTSYFPGNYIVVAGDSEARMQWISSGTVAVLSVRADLTETTHELLTTGDVFGILQGLSKGIEHCFSYRAETKVSILTLCLDSWKDILQHFPDARRIIMEKSEILFTRF
ncbi:cGMP-gated cation channel alpha-1-like [Leptidea sinapis]|uniref:cGMP-gated cation channel alpha-1-like n=1 Tax=Leptidea sinapis TaxID=189913 RepID=UPI0021C25B29|nr:cGMP-gated cation channel alpha-1-like [Leptidea sinapis]